MHTLFHIIGVATLSSIALSCNLYVSHRLVAPRYGNKGMRIYFLIHCFILLILATIGITASMGGMQENLSTLVWVMYSFMLIYLPLFSYLLVSWIDYLKRPRGKMGHYLGCALAILSIITTVGATFNRYRIQVKDVTIESHRLPQEFDNYRIVHISDLHLEMLYSRSYAQKIVDRINELQPHIILFTGDLVHRRAIELNDYKDILSQLQARDGIFSVMGNHDYGDFVKWRNEAERLANLQLLDSLQAGMGWNKLDNDHTFIYCDNDSIAIIGVENWGEPPFQQHGDLEVAYPTLQDDNFKILLSHNPRHWEAHVLPQSNIDITLSGHTHAMQWSIGKWSPAVIRYKQWGGLYQENEQYLYVNIGLGCTMTPTRLGATPEITLITLKTAQ